MIRRALSDRRRRFQEKPEDGFTLAELVVYSILLVLVIGIAGSLFLSIIRAQGGIRSQAETNNSAQLLYKQLEREIRNASWAEISASGDLLVLQTRTATESDFGRDQCVSYYYDEGSQEVRRAVGRVNSSEALAADDVELPGVTSTWNVSRDRVTPLEENAFGPMDRKYGANELIEVSLVFETLKDKPPVSYSKSVGLRPQGLAEGCS